MESTSARSCAQTTVTPVFLIPGTGATRHNVESEEHELALVRAELARFGEVQVLFPLPDIDHHTDACTDLAGAVTRIATTIRSHCGATPPILVGYSSGGFTAFVVARALEAQGLPVRLVVMLDSAAYYRPKAVKSPWRDGGHFDLRLMPGRLIQTPFFLAMNKGKVEMARRWLTMLRPLTGAARINKMRLQLLIWYWALAAAKVELSPWNGRVLLIKAQKARTRITDPQLGWTPYLPNLEIVVVEGDHWSLCRQPTTAHHLRESLAALA